jgi:hypothetical protein
LELVCVAPLTALLAPLMYGAKSHWLGEEGLMLLVEAAQSAL